MTELAAWRRAADERRQLGRRTKALTRVVNSDIDAEGRTLRAKKKTRSRERARAQRRSLDRTRRPALPPQWRLPLLLSWG